MSFVTGPIAPESNPPIEPQWFKPSVFPITSIAYGVSTVITTGTAFGVANNYVVGQNVRINIPFTYGAQQLNGQEAYVIGTAPNQVTVAINTSSGYDNFIATPNYGPTPPQIAAIGDINSGSINKTPAVSSTLIAGSFQNISPAVSG